MAASDELQKRRTSSEKMPGFQLRITNRLWAQEGVRLLPEFLETAKTRYRADLGLVDFQHAEACQTPTLDWY
jgi:serine protease inhibitor